ncbi:MAG TPA: GNAT family N-acetyltransferase [Firmicutes bacterium]|jgi:putative acetyltransferase|nr:GNAT family N-acetyltransferase [Bacillota bacterium]HAV20210.1 GNAT family N-acetyltransferase [Bacillota bacterium]
MKTLETPRLILRPFTLKDLPAFFAYAKKENIGPNAGWKPHQSIEESETILKQFINAETLWAITLKKDGHLIGSIGLHEDKHRHNPRVKSLGYVLDDVFWGQGIVTEAARRVIRYAFEMLEIDMLSVGHYPLNERSKRVVEKCGFIYEATLRQAVVRYDGTVLDLVLYYLDRHQYNKIKTTL